MKAMLLVLGSVLLRMLHMQAAIPTQKNLNIRKVEGLWYTSLMASKSKTFRNDNRNRKMWINVLRFRINGDLVLRTLAQNGSTCEENVMVLERTGVPTAFRISRKPSSDFHILKTNYKDVLIVYAHKIYPWQNDDPILFLYGRAIYRGICVMGLYRSLVRKLHLSKNSIIRLRKPWKCLDVTG